MHLQRLKKLYPSLTELPKNQKEVNPDFKWYQLENTVIGIDNKELTDRDKILLGTFLTSYHVQLPIQTPKEKQWEARIHRQKDANLGKAGRYRFIFFESNKDRLIQMYSEKRYRNFFQEIYLYYGIIQMKGLLSRNRPVF